MSLTPVVYIDDEENNHIVPISIDRVMAPAINTMTLKLMTGKVNGTQEPFADGQLTTVPFADHRNKSVRIELTDEEENEDKVCGHIIDIDQSILGVDSENVRLSDDTFVAYGYEYFLDKNVIQNSIVHGPVTINRALPFNTTSDSGQRIGNMKTSAEGPFYFSTSIQTGNSEWTGHTVVLYLLEHFKNKYGYDFELTGDSSILSALASIKGAWSAKGKSYWSLLNEIINPKYGFCFHVEGENEDDLRIVVNTIVGTTTGSVPANSSQVTVNLASSHKFSDVNLRFIEDSSYGKIILRGGRYAFTNSFTIDQFDEVWTSDDLDDYNDSETTDDERRELKKEGIFTKFFLKPISQWGPEESPTPGKIDGVPAFPIIDTSDGSIKSTNQNIYEPTFKFLGNLAVRKDGQAIQPFAFMDDMDDEQHRMDNPSNGSGIDLYVLPDRAGIQFRPRIPHLIAGEEFDSDEAESDIEPLFDYKTLVVTLSYMSDDHLELEYIIDANNKKELILEEPSLRVSVILDGTFLPDEIVAESRLDDNGLPDLKALGELAKVWYAKQKARLSWKYKDAEIVERLGQLITTATVGDVENSVNTIISRVTYNFTYGQNRGATTNLSTEFKNIDLKSILGKNLSTAIDQVSNDVAELKQKVANIPNKPAIASGSAGGGSLVWATSPRPTYEFGAKLTEPGGDPTALNEDAVFKISTPWNTTVLAPDKMYAWWNKVGDNYYTPVETFYLKAEEDYSATEDAGITDFTCYLNQAAVHSIGTDGDFPAGIKVLRDGFEADSASSNSRTYFNGQIFPASYDPENNIIYIGHPLVG